jgi:hypothetical protein
MRAAVRKAGRPPLRPFSTPGGKPAAPAAEHLLLRLVPHKVRGIVTKYGVPFIGIYFSLYWGTWFGVYTALRTGVAEGDEMMGIVRGCTAWLDKTLQLPERFSFAHHLKLDGKTAVAASMCGVHQWQHRVSVCLCWRGNVYIVQALTS